MALAPSKNEEKGKLQWIMSLRLFWLSKEYSAPMEDTVVLVGKSVYILGTTSGGFTPPIAGGGPMKPETPL